jgi:DNA-binding CsgD family transcriptional regulator
VLHGRDREREAARVLVEAAAAGRGGVLVVRGERGSGRTALLDEAATAPVGCVLRVTGVPAEAELSFAAVHRLLHPLRHRLDRLPDPQRAALRVVLGWEHRDFDPFRIALGVLTLLSDEAAQAPLLVTVDDAEHLDRASTEVFGFVARRVAAERVAVLVATADTGRDDWADLPTLRLRPLHRKAARQVVEDVCPEVTDEVADRLIHDAAGNPLLLHELCAALPHGVRHHRQAAPEHLAPAGRLGRALADRVAALPAGSRTALLVVAAEDGGALTAVLGASRALGADGDALTPLVARGLVVVEGGRVRCHPPALRSVVYLAQPLPARVRAHRALAEVLAGDPARRVRHLAECTLEVDEELAKEVAAVGERAGAAGDAVAAAKLLQQAAQLTGDAPTRAAHLVDAAVCLWTAGDPGQALDLIELAGPQVEGVGPVAGIALVRLLAGLVGDTPPAAAHRALLDTARPLLDSRPRPAEQLLAAAAYAAWLAGDPVGVRAADDLRAAREPTGEHTCYLGDVSEFVPAVPGPASFVGDVAALVDDVEAGRWARAETAATALLHTAADNDHLNAACLANAVLAWLAAMRGQAERCARHAESALAVAEPHGVALAGALATWATGLLALGEGRIDDAVQHLRTVVADRTPRAHPAVALAAVADLLESMVRDADYAGAWALVHEFDLERAGLRRQFRGALALRCRALVAGRDGGPLFEKALRQPGVPQFEVARTQLVYGEWLRRHREVRAARGRLRAALDVFDRLGCLSWAERCRAELRASGAPSGPPRVEDRVDLADLTPREREIVRTVITGKTNREVAAELFISPRTVGDHLHKLYSKLGISSRHELRFLFTDEQDGQDQRAPRTNRSTE